MGNLMILVAGLYAVVARSVLMPWLFGYERYEPGRARCEMLRHQPSPNLRSINAWPCPPVSPPPPPPGSPPRRCPAWTLPTSHDARDMSPPATCPTAPWVLARTSDVRRKGGLGQRSRIWDSRIHPPKNPHERKPSDSASAGSCTSCSCCACLPFTNLTAIRNQSSGCYLTHPPSLPPAPCEPATTELVNLRTTTCVVPRHPTAERISRASKLTTLPTHLSQAMPGGAN